jgi:hypothetical protein
MTVASASTETRVSYQPFQSSSMLRPLSKARLAQRKSHCQKDCLCDQECNATFRRASFDRGNMTYAELILRSLPLGRS